MRTGTLVSAEDALAAALAEADGLMVCRNAGSGTRILIDRLLKGARPPGYWSQPRSHNAVAAAVAQGRADWGVTIDSVARRYDLSLIPVQDEHYDFVVPSARLDRPAVQRFRAVLEDATLRAALAEAGSLRTALSEVAQTFESANSGLKVESEFGPSGLLRERIEKGEGAHVFASGVFFSKMTDDDIDALVAWVRTLPPLE